MGLYSACQITYCFCTNKYPILLPASPLNEEEHVARRIKQRFPKDTLINSPE